MFGFFKKKSKTTKASSVVLSEEQLVTLHIAANMLKAEIMMTDGSDAFLESKFVRGYIVGFLDASLQHKSIEPIDFDGYFSAIQNGCLFLFDDNLRLSVEYAPQSLVLIGDEQFEKASKVGGTEYFEYMQGVRRIPNGISKYYFSGDWKSGI